LSKIFETYHVKLDWSWIKEFQPIVRSTTNIDPTRSRDATDADNHHIRRDGNITAC
jgi:hypothetical protein